MTLTDKEKIEKVLKIIDDMLEGIEREKEKDRKNSRK